MTLMNHLLSTAAALLSQYTILVAAVPIRNLKSDTNLINLSRDTFFEKLTNDWISVVVTVFISIPWLGRLPSYFFNYITPTCEIETEILNRKANELCCVFPKPAVIGVFDAIDSKYRSAKQVAQRLTVATIFLLCAYTLGIFFVIGLIQYTSSETSTDDRYDEVATILVLLFFNLWHIGRNVRGWTQFVAVRKMHPVFQQVQSKFAETYPRENTDHCDEEMFLETKCKRCIQGLLRLQISNRLIDNDVQATTPFLSPLFKLKPVANGIFPTAEEDAWAVAIWRAWWTQDVTKTGNYEPTLDAPQSFRCDKANRYRDVEDLERTEPSALGNGMVVRNQDTNDVISTPRDWATALLTYGGPEENTETGESPEGQQDTHGEALPPVASPFNASGVALLVKEKTRVLPHRMSALWYATARFEEVYESRAFDSEMRTRSPQVMFPKWAGWISIARGIAADGISQISLTDRTITLLAGELASASLILVRYPARYKRLVDLIHRDGLNARWTFGWSGLLACFSHLWTKERIYIVMLNGLSLLALTLSTDVEEIDPNVRSMLYGYAAFAVSDRAVGRRIAQDRKAELHRRYKQNKGKTCRGSGLHAMRLACQTLGIPEEASHMDGLPSFSTGWCGEYLERKPGNQSPEHGNNHDQAEARQGSSNVFRYPGGCF